MPPHTRRETAARIEAGGHEAQGREGERTESALDKGGQTSDKAAPPLPTKESFPNGEQVGRGLVPVTSVGRKRRDIREKGLTAPVAVPGIEIAVRSLGTSTNRFATAGKDVEQTWKNSFNRLPRDRVERLAATFPLPWKFRQQVPPDNLVSKVGETAIVAAVKS